MALLCSQYLYNNPNYEILDWFEIHLTYHQDCLLFERELLVQEVVGLEVMEIVEIIDVMDLKLWK